MIILVRAYTHGGLGTVTASQRNIFDSEKLTIFFIVLLTGFEPVLLDLESDAQLTPSFPLEVQNVSVVDRTHTLT